MNYVMLHTRVMHYVMLHTRVMHYVMLHSRVLPCSLPGLALEFPLVFLK